MLDDDERRDLALRRASIVRLLATRDAVERLEAGDWDGATALVDADRPIMVNASDGMFGLPAAVRDLAADLENADETLRAWRCSS